MSDDSLHDALVDTRQLPIIARGLEELGGAAWSIDALISGPCSGALRRTFADVKADRVAALSKRKDLGLDGPPAPRTAHGDAAKAPPSGVAKAARERKKAADLGLARKPAAPAQTPSLDEAVSKWDDRNDAVSAMWCATLSACAALQCSAGGHVLRQTALLTRERVGVQEGAARRARGVTEEGRAERGGACGGLAALLRAAARFGRSQVRSARASDRKTPGRGVLLAARRARSPAP